MNLLPKTDFGSKRVRVTLYNGVFYSNFDNQEVTNHSVRMSLK